MYAYNMMLVLILHVAQPHYSHFSNSVQKTPPRAVMSFGPGTRFYASGKPVPWSTSTFSTFLKYQKIGIWCSGKTPKHTKSRGAEAVGVAGSSLSHKFHLKSQGMYPAAKKKKKSQKSGWKLMLHLGKALALDRGGNFRLIRHVINAQGKHCINQKIIQNSLRPHKHLDF